ncbi:MAG TPA: T9SS type A sorting domain-containing protein, partial [Flavobacteriales bacterium]|nr:T9SS type A sorting domain-containing protein [Flavobacteriales bacterium]
TYNAQTQEYESELEVSVQAAGLTTGLEELRHAEQFAVGQNEPNPYSGRTTVPITLKQAGDVVLDLFDLQGRKVTSVQRKGLGAGLHTIPLDMDELGIPTASYVYQVQVTNASGVWRMCKRMTALR